MYTLQRFIVAAAAATLAWSAGAQTLARGPLQAMSANVAAGAYEYSSPPARVARLAYISGDVSFAPAGENEWYEAQLNRPVVTGDSLWTDRGSRVELQLDSSAIRLDRDTSFDFLDLDDQLAQMELTQGSLNLDIRRLHGDETYEVDTPTVAFVAGRVGDYRIDVDPDGYTVVTARRGGGDVYGEGGRRVVVEEGQSVTFYDSGLADYRVDRAGRPDAFDRFALERSRRYAHADSRRYVSAGVVGYEDLDRYGSWDDVADYGHVWYPRHVAAGWAPYHDGHWVWVDPWGWTWVDNAPWGFAPFHYGRWAYIGSRWGWIPGPLDARPVYAPALVAFIGGSGFNIRLSTGPIGWFALGPRDVYFPGYHCDRDYFARINISNTYVTRNVVNNYYGSWSSGSLNYSRIRYFNRDAPRAITAVPGSAFVAGRSVRTAAVAVNRHTFARARILPRATLTPTRASLVAGRGHASAPPHSVRDRRVVAARRPPAARPSFAQRQAMLRKNAGEPLSPRQLNRLARQHAPAHRGHAAVARNVRVVGRSGPVVSAPQRTTRPGHAAHERGARTAAQDTARNEHGRHVRSSGFAEHGPAARPQRNAHASDRANAREQQAQARARGRAQREQRTHEPARAGGEHVRSSNFAHETRHGNSARAARHSPPHREASARPSQSRAHERGTARTERTPARARHENQHRTVQHAPAAHAAHGERQTAHAARPTHSNAPAQRARSEHRAVGSPQRHEPRAAAHSKNRQRPQQHVAGHARQAPRAQQQAERRAPAQRQQQRESAPQRAQTHAPPQEHRRAPPPKRQMAHSATKNRQQHGNDKGHDGKQKRDKNGHGGG